MSPPFLTLTMLGSTSTVARIWHGAAVQTGPRRPQATSCAFDSLAENVSFVFRVQADQGEEGGHRPRRLRTGGNLARPAEQGRAGAGHANPLETRDRGEKPQRGLPFPACTDAARRGSPAK